MGVVHGFIKYVDIEPPKAAVISVVGLGVEIYVRMSQASVYKASQR